MLQKMKKYISPASDRACGAKHPSLILYHYVSRNTPATMCRMRSRKRSNVPDFKKNRENAPKWWLDYIPNTVLCFGLTLRNIETRAHPDGEPCTAIVLIVMCLKITYPGGVSRQKWCNKLKDMPVLSPPPNRACGDKQPSIICIMFYRENTQATACRFAKTVNGVRL